MSSVYKQSLPSNGLNPSFRTTAALLLMACKRTRAIWSGVVTRRLSNRRVDEHLLLRCISTFFCGVLQLQNDFLKGCRWTHSCTSCFFELDDTSNDGVRGESLNCGSPPRLVSPQSFEELERQHEREYRRCAFYVTTSVKIDESYSLIRWSCSRSLRFNKNGNRDQTAGMPPAFSPPGSSSSPSSSFLRTHTDPRMPTRETVCA